MPSRSPDHLLQASALLGIALLMPVMTHAEDTPTIQCRWAEGVIVIDGQPGEDAWKKAEWTTAFWNLGATTAEQTRTRATLLWSDQGLYVAGVMQDADLYARVVRHDGNTWDDDVFEFFLMPGNVFADPKHTGKPYYEFEVNALNTTFDLLFDNTGDQKRDFLTGISREAFTWKTAVHLTGTLNDGPDRDSAWTVEGFIPWSDLTKTGGMPLLGDTWRGIFARYDFPASGKNPIISASAAMTLEKGFHDPGRWARVHFNLPRSVP